jgi:hypothetical protein
MSVLKPPSFPSAPGSSPANSKVTPVAALFGLLVVGLLIWGAISLVVWLFNLLNGWSSGWVGVSLLIAIPVLVLGAACWFFRKWLLQWLTPVLLSLILITCLIICWRLGAGIPVYVTNGSFSIDSEKPIEVWISKDNPVKVENDSLDKLADTVRDGKVSVSPPSPEQ